MRTDFLIGGLLVALLIALVAADYSIANQRTKEAFDSRYLTCTANLAAEKATFDARPDSNPQKSSFIQCTNQGGCYQSCGSPCDSGPSLSVGAYFEQRLSGQKACVKMCVSKCLMPPAV